MQLRLHGNELFSHQVNLAARVIGIRSGVNTIR